MQDFISDVVQTASTSSNTVEKRDDNGAIVYPDVLANNEDIALASTTIDDLCKKYDVNPLQVLDAERARRGVNQDERTFALSLINELCEKHGVSAADWPRHLEQLRHGLPFEAKKVEPPTDDELVARASTLLDELCTKHGVNASHGLLHARAVLDHAEKAIAAASPPLTSQRALAVRLAALLHDADDKKYFGKECAKELRNALQILLAIKAESSVVGDVFKMINWTSCSANGNNCPQAAKDSPEYLWPRWADRLEAAGEIGVARCYVHNQKDGAPLAIDGETPRCNSDEEAFALATEERFKQYQERGGSSASMIDHYFDKLLQVARPPPDIVRNSYLEEAARDRVEPLLKVVRAYGETGEVPVAYIEEMVERCGLK